VKRERLAREAGAERQGVKRERLAREAGAERQGAEREAGAGRRKKKGPPEGGPA